MSTNRYKERLVEIEASQWTPDASGHDSEVTDWLDSWSASYVVMTNLGYSARIEINGANGTVVANPSDWVIRDQLGRFWVAQQDDFYYRYELVPDTNL